MLKVRIILVRRVTGCIINVFAPSTLIVMVSWVNFWLRIDAAPARVALSITSLLTLCTQVTQHKALLPPLNYITAMDIWLFVCISTVFCTLVEFAISYNYYTASKVKSYVGIKKDDTFLQLSNIEGSLSKEKRKTQKMNVSVKDGILKRFALQIKMIYDYIFHSHSAQENNVDAFCRVAFPLFFILFAIIYWIHYLRNYDF